MLAASSVLGGRRYSMILKVDVRFPFTSLLALIFRFIGVRGKNISVKRDWTSKAFFMDRSRSMEDAFVL